PLSRPAFGQCVLPLPPPPQPPRQEQTPRAERAPCTRLQSPGRDSHRHHDWRTSPGLPHAAPSAADPPARVLNLAVRPAAREWEARWPKPGLGPPESRAAPLSPARCTCCARPLLSGALPRSARRPPPPHEPDRPHLRRQSCADASTTTTAAYLQLQQRAAPVARAATTVPETRRVRAPPSGYAHWSPPEARTPRTRQHSQPAADEQRHLCAPLPGRTAPAADQHPTPPHDSGQYDPSRWNRVRRKPGQGPVPERWWWNRAGPGR